MSKLCVLRPSQEASMAVAKSCFAVAGEAACRVETPFGRVGTELCP